MVRARENKLVVRMLRGDFFKLADDEGFFLDGGFDLSYEGGVYNLERDRLDVLFLLILQDDFFFYNE